MASLFEAYITNLGKYNEGELVGETLKFPTTTEEVQGLLKRIGVDGVRYEEFFITSFDGDVLGLYDYLTEYENLDELNHLACLLSELDQGELEKFEAVIDSGEHKYSHVASLREIEENEYNLNIPRYVDTFEEEKLIDLESVNKEIADIKGQIATLEKEMEQCMKELGLSITG